MKNLKNKKGLGALVAVLALALVGALGTYAWITKDAELTNSFTTSDGILPPTTDPDDPNNPAPTDSTKINGNLTETKWDKDNAKLTANATIAKNPNVGLGKGSEDSYIFLNVTNNTTTEATNTTSRPYFVIDATKWAPVSNYTSSVSGVDNGYYSGLFVYTGGTGTDPVELTASTTADVWTGELFSQVVVPSTAVKSEFSTSPQIVVKAYLAASENSSETATGAKDNAITFFGLNS